ncbi:hypothetical protein GGR56DRAFT_254484 [Xylariaceae sp. FL0804]|nr:hypothetical protein GGR56DRAFT_254484 [Xylariaceae sp. FL0804]
MGPAAHLHPCPAGWEERWKGRALEDRQPPSRCYGTNVLRMSVRTPSHTQRGCRTPAAGQKLAFVGCQSAPRFRLHYDNRSGQALVAAYSIFSSLTARFFCVTLDHGLPVSMVTTAPGRLLCANRQHHGHGPDRANESKLGSGSRNNRLTFDSCSHFPYGPVSGITGGNPSRKVELPLFSIRCQTISWRIKHVAGGISSNTPGEQPPAEASAWVKGPPTTKVLTSMMVEAAVEVGHRLPAKDRAS